MDYEYVEEEITMKSIPLVEQETTISFSRTEDGAEIWTSDKTMMTKLDRLCSESPENYKLIKADKVKGTDAVAFKTYHIADKKLISFRSRKIQRELTEEQKMEIAERFKRSRER